MILTKAHMIDSQQVPDLVADGPSLRFDAHYYSIWFTGSRFFSNIKSKSQRINKHMVLNLFETDLPCLLFCGERHKCTPYLWLRKMCALRISELYLRCTSVGIYAVMHTCRTTEYSSYQDKAQDILLQIVVIYRAYGQKRSFNESSSTLQEASNSRFEIISHWHANELQLEVTEYKYFTKFTQFDRIPAAFGSL